MFEMLQPKQQLEKACLHRNGKFEEAEKRHVDHPDEHKDVGINL